MAQISYLHLCDLAFSDQAGKHCVIGIPEVGRYTFKVLAAKEVLASQSLRLQKLENQSQTPPTTEKSKLH